MVKLTCLASCTAVALLLFVIEPAFAEFQIQEAGIEKGKVELEFRGAYHWGVPQVTDTNENANNLVQSHEFELQMGITDWWLLSVTTGLDQPRGESLQGNAVEIGLSSHCSSVKAKGSLFPSKLAMSRRSIMALESTATPISSGSGPSLSLPKVPSY